MAEVSRAQEPGEPGSVTREVRDELLPAAGGKAIGLLTLDSPKTLNALSLSMTDALIASLKPWARDPQVTLVVIRASGDRAFSAGGDLRRLYQSMRPETAAQRQDADYPERFFIQEYRLDYLLRTYPKPVLTWGAGLIMGGGLGVYTGGSHRVVTENSRVSSPEISIGLFPDAGATRLLTDMPGSLGLFSALTGAVHNAADALIAGSATHFIRHDRQEAVLSALAAASWQGDSEHDRAMLTAMLGEVAEIDTPALPEAQVTARRAVIDSALSGKTEHAEIIDAVLGLAEQDPWFAKGAATLSTGCPTSAAIIIEQLRRGAGMPLVDIMRMEMILAAQCARHPDFAEGIRARIIEKDNQPRWSQPDLRQVPPEVLEAHFTPPWDQHPLADLGHE